MKIPLLRVFCLPVCVCTVYMPAARGGGKLEGCEPPCVLGIELGSSGRAAVFLTTELSSPALT